MCQSSCCSLGRGVTSGGEVLQRDLMNDPKEKFNLSMKVPGPRDPKSVREK